MIGSGSAGAVVASRLSEIKHWRVLLLEAGPDENEISDVSLIGFVKMKTSSVHENCISLGKIFFILRQSKKIDFRLIFLNSVLQVPSLAAYLQLSKLDWGYKTEPSSKSCLGMKNNRCNWPRGKVLGGSRYFSQSSRTFPMIHNRKQQQA